MKVIECITSRHSYRGEYIEDYVPSKEELKTIMEAGLAAPSGSRFSRGIRKLRERDKV